MLSRNLTSLSRGFTLLELLVAASITVVLAGIMLTVTSNVLTSWNRSQGALQAESRSRLALDQLADDLQGALYRNDASTWLAVIVQGENSVSGALWQTAGTARNAGDSLDVAATRGTLAATDRGKIAHARFGAAGTWLRLITSRGAGVEAAPVAASYQIIRRRSPGVSADSAAHYLLYRAEVSAAETFASGYDLPTAAYRTQLEQPPELRFIADNVIDFGIWLYTRGPAGSLTRVFPVASELEHFAKAPATSATPVERFPDLADVMIRVLTPEGVRQIQAIENGQLNADWWTVAEANSKVYVRRITLRSAPF